MMCLYPNAHYLTGGKASTQLGGFSKLDEYHPVCLHDWATLLWFSVTAVVNLNKSDSSTITFLANKRKRPCKDVHEVGQPVWVGGTVELSNVHHIVLILQHRRLGEQYNVQVI